MDILIIGGSRFVGPHLISLLLEKNHTLTVFNRGNIRSSYPAGVRFIRGDRDTGIRADGTFDAVIDMCAFTGRQTQTALRDLKFGYFLNFGTVASYKKTQVFPLTEDSPIGEWPAFGQYNTGKVECENVLAVSGIPFATIRPAYILGPENCYDREHFIYTRIKNGAPLILPGNGLGLTQFVFVDEVARAIVTLVEGRVRGAFNIAGSEIITNTGLAEMMGTIAGKQPIIRFNPDAVGTGYREDEFPFDNENLIVSNEKIRKLGVEFVLLEAGLRRDYAHYYRERT